MRVLQLIDSLQTGGAERVAVNIANALSAQIEYSALCATREEGLLKDDILKNVDYLFLDKKRTLDIKSINRFRAFVKKNRVQVIHAHSSSFFLATIIKLFNNNISIVWHDHYGNSEFVKNRKFGILKWCSKYFSHIFSVNKALEAWAKQKLKIKNVSYLPNFATLNKGLAITVLKGNSGKRIICLANLRPQKDHVTLVKAFKEVNNQFPDWSLHCVGKNFNDKYSKLVVHKIKRLNLEESVFLYDSKPDIYNILEQCEIGVLSSKSEGLPIALLEYGLSNLAVIATKVGECKTLISHQFNGILVNSLSPKELANAIILYIENKELRHTFSKRYNQHIEKNYSDKAQIETIIKTYNSYAN
jgi:glycosyltransferase involved in cell wall biosynthesis